MGFEPTRRGVIRSIPVLAVPGCVGFGQPRGGSIVVENDSAEERTVSVAVVDGRFEGRTESQVIPPNEQFAWSEFVDAGGEYTVRVTVEGLGSDEVHLEKVYDSNAGEYVSVIIQDDEFSASVVT